MIVRRAGQTVAAGVGSWGARAAAGAVALQSRCGASAAERERIKNLAPILRWAEVHWLRFKECYMIQTGAPPDDELVYALPDVVLIYLGLVKPPFNGSYEWQPTHHHHFQYPPVGG